MTDVEPKLVDVFRRLATSKAPWPLFLHGPVGTGKTAAALCLCDFVERAGFATLDELCDAVMGREVHGGWVLRDLELYDLVVVDEIGTRERVGDLYHSTLQHVLDVRERCAEHRAIYISNVAPVDLGGVLDDRCVSRLIRGTVFELTGDDRRQKGGNSK